MSFSIRRTIEIDMGHRVPTHGSKCWNLHGHRYVIEAEVHSDALQSIGTQRGMVMDFGFLKEFMMQQIHNFCDHGLCLWMEDPWLARFVTFPERVVEAAKSEGWKYIPGEKNTNQTQLLVVPFIPTAEHLAEFWFDRLKHPIQQHTSGRGELKRLYVWETPNSVAIFPSRGIQTGAGGYHA